MRQIVKRWVRVMGWGGGLVRSALLAALASVLFVAPARAEDAPGPRYFYTYVDPSTGQKTQVPLGLDQSRIAVFRDAEFERSGGQRGALGPALAGFGIDGAGVSAMAVKGWASAPVAGGGARSAEQVEEMVGRIAAAGAAVADFVSPVFTDARGPVLITRDLMIGFEAGVTEAQALAAIEGMNVGRVLERHYGGLPGVYLVRADSRDGFAVLGSANAIAARPDVRFAEPDRIMTVLKHLIPNDALFGLQWGLNNTGQSGGTPDIDMNIPEAWDTTTGVSAIRVLVMDDGIDLTHPDLASNIAEAVDFTDDAGDGSHQNDCDGHGTAVSGCVVAAFNNSIGVAGVAPSCRVLSARVSISNMPCDGTGSTSITWIVNAINYAQAQGVRVSNASFGIGSSSTLDSAYSTARSGGMVHFASAGNGGPDGVGDSTIEYPASSPAVNSVAAITRTGALASFSNFGTGLDFAAPGQEILTTDRQGTAGFNTDAGTAGDFVEVDGTSFASPYTAGVAALILSRNSSQTAAQVEMLIQMSARDLGAMGYDSTFGHGLPRAGDAVSATPPPPAPGPFNIISPTAGQTDVSVTPTFSWTASSNATSYDLLIAANSQLTQIVFSTSVSDTSYMLADALAFSTTYFVRVTARNSAGATNSAIREFTTTAAAPTDVPGSFNLLSPFNGASGVNLAPTFLWSSAEGAADYLLEVDEDSGFGSPEIAITLSSLIYTHTGEPLDFAATYYWRVTANNILGSTASTPASASFTTEATPPLDPPGFFALQNPPRGQPGVSLLPAFTWGASSDADQYQIEVDDDEAFGSPEIDTVVMGTSYAHTGSPLDEARRYFWRVTASNIIDSIVARPDPSSFQTTSDLRLRIFLDSTELLTGDAVDFGVVDKGSTQVRTLKIQNIGRSPVNVGKPKASGKGYSAKGNSVRNLLPGQMVQFQAKLSTGKPGDFVGTFQFTRSDDPSEPFLIDLLGTVIPPAPQVRLAMATVPVNDGDLLDAGMTLVGQPRTLIFNVTNPGKAALKLGTLSLNGALASSQSGAGPRGGSGYSITQQPGKTVNPGKSTQFRIRMDALASGTPMTTVILPTNDPLFPEFVFDLLGEVNLPGPDVTVQVASSIVANGGSTHIGSILSGIRKVFPISVRNTGTATLNLGPISSSSPSYEISVQPNTTIPAGGSSTGFLTIDGSGGVSSAMFSFNSDDPDDNPFNFTVNATVVPAPDMEVRVAATLVLDGGNFAFGQIAPGVATIRTFTINNLGSAALTLGILSVQFPTSGAFTIQLPNPSNTTIQPGNSANFNVQAFVGAANQSFMDTILIPNNDPDENPYNFTVTAISTGGAPVASAGDEPIPSLSWEGLPLPPGASVTLPATPLGAPLEASLRLANGGAGPLSIHGISLQGSGFSLVLPLPAGVPPEGSAEIRVRLDADRVGTAATVLTIRSNALGGFGEYSVLLSGEVTAP